MTRSSSTLRTGCSLLVVLAAGCSSAADNAPGNEQSSSNQGDAGGTSLGTGRGSSGSGSGSSAGPDAAGPGVSACEVATGFQATTTSASAVSLSWPAGAASVSIGRKSYCGSDAYEVLTTSSSATSFTDTTVQASWVYWYEMTAKDASGSTVSNAIATQASTSPEEGCGGGLPPQPSGADAATSCGGSSADAGQADAGQGPVDAAMSTDGGVSLSCPAPSGIGTDITKAPYNVSNTGSDTTAALQSAITALAAKNEAAFFPAGTYLISATINLPANTTLNSNAGAKIQIASGFPSTFMFSTTGSNVTIDGLTFDGDNLEVSALALNPGQGYTVINSTFQNSLTASNAYTGEVTFYGMSSGSNVSHNAFTNIGPASYTPTDITNDYAPVGIYIDVAANVVDTHLDDNLLNGVGEGIHGPSSSGTLHMDSTNLEIARNVMSHIHRIPVEIQGAGSNLTVKDNYVSDYVKPYWSTFGLSIAAPSTANILIEGNVLNGVSTDAITGFWGIGLEAGGYPVTVTGNYVYGFAGQVNSVALISAHHTTANNFVTGNTFCGTAGDGAFYENPSTASTNWEAPSPGDVLSPNSAFTSCTSAPAMPAPSPIAGPCKP
jgi:hypothetical protein